MGRTAPGRTVGTECRACPGAIARRDHGQWNGRAGPRAGGAERSVRRPAAAASSRSGPCGEGALEQLEAELAARGSTPNEVLRREQSRQAANQVTVGNCVLSLRLLSAIDWNAFFEQTSHVEAVLRDDPAGVYARQDFATSDRYRRAVEMIARGSKPTRSTVARRAVELARRGHGSSEPRDHVGYYLIDRGQAELKAAFGYRPAGASACGLGPGPSGMDLFRVDRGRARGLDGACRRARASGACRISWWIARAGRGVAAAALRAGRRHGQPAR